MLSVSNEDVANPFAAPVAFQNIEQKDQARWSALRILAWLFFCASLEAIITIFIVFARDGDWTFFKIVRPQYVHLFLTVGVIFASFFLLKRKARFRFSVIAAQASNAIQWLTFWLTLSILNRLGMSRTSLSLMDLQFFFGIFATLAVLLAILSWIFFRVRKGAVTSSL